MEVPALYFIVFKLIIRDNIVEPGLAPAAIAYSAHLAGYAFGIAATLILLATGLTASSSFDLWAMIKRWNRRRRYRDAVSSGYDPFTGQTAAKPVKVREVKKTAAQKQQEDGADKAEELPSLARRRAPGAQERGKVGGPDNLSQDDVGTEWDAVRHEVGIHLDAGPKKVGQKELLNETQSLDDQNDDGYDCGGFDNLPGT